MPRKYFPFYFSFYETAQTMPPRIRATFYEAIIQYGVTGKEPTLPKSISGYWPIIQPVLDTSHKRYDAAKKRNKSSENNGFATYKEKEKEKENEKERDSRKQKRSCPMCYQHIGQPRAGKIWLLSFPPSIISHHRLEWRDFFENL